MVAQLSNNWKAKQCKNCNGNDFCDEASSRCPEKTLFDKLWLYLKLVSPWIIYVYVFIMWSWLTVLQPVGFAGKYITLNCDDFEKSFSIYIQ